jgi:hypothetical protein
MNVPIPTQVKELADKYSHLVKPLEKIVKGDGPKNAESVLPVIDECTLKIHKELRYKRPDLLDAWIVYATDVKREILNGSSVEPYILEDQPLSGKF